MEEEELDGRWGAYFAPTPQEISPAGYGSGTVERDDSPTGGIWVEDIPFYGEIRIEVEL